MPVTRHPPHRPVLALLTHTVPTSDGGGQTHLRVRVKHLHWGRKHREALQKTLPSPYGPLAATAKLPQPQSQYVVAKRSKALLLRCPGWP